MQENGPKMAQTPYLKPGSVRAGFWRFETEHDRAQTSNPNCPKINVHLRYQTSFCLNFRASLFNRRSTLIPRSRLLTRTKESMPPSTIPSLQVIDNRQFEVLFFVNNFCNICQVKSTSNYGTYVVPLVGFDPLKSAFTYVVKSAVALKLLLLLLQQSSSHSNIGK